MSRIIRVDAFRDLEFVVSDSEAAGIDWGNSNEDTIVFETVDQEDVYLNWDNIAVITISGAAPPPGSTLPGYRMLAAAADGSFNAHINEATRDALVASLNGPGSENMIMEFTTLNGYDVRLPNKNILYISFQPDDLVTAP